MTALPRHLFSKPIFRIPAHQRYKVQLPAETPDAAAIALAAQEAFEAKEHLVVICADAADIDRLADEIRWFRPETPILTLPDWETLPYDVLSPQESLVSHRLETLYRLTQRQQPGAVILASAITAAQRMAPTEYVASHTFFFRVGGTLERKSFISQLVSLGYVNVKEVFVAGEFSVRGSIIDLFPMGSDRPIRFDLFDDEIDSIRYFDVETQRSQESVKEIRVLPGHEFPVDDEALTNFRQRWRLRFPGDPSKYLPYNDAGNHLLSPGIEYYLPLFFDQTATLGDYLHENARVIFLGNVQERLQSFWTDTESRARVFRADPVRPALSVKELWLTHEEFFTSLQKCTRITIDRIGDRSAIDGVAIDRHSQEPCHRLMNFLATAKIRNERVLLLASSLGRRETMADLFRSQKVPYSIFDSLEEFLADDRPVGLLVSPLIEGGRIEQSQLILLTETELYAASPQRVRAKGKARHPTNVEMLVRDITELKIGDPVVHIEHGIGRYQGLERIETPEGPTEFLRIDYKNDAQLFVPIANLHLISRYSGADSTHAPLHTLGRGDWEKAKRKAAQQVRDTAAELLHLYALRETRQGFAFKISEADWEAFREGFAFEETPDQAAAIQAVFEDMTSPRPMDRLVCGDVGFGKTEVALRAAFLAVMGGKQVAFLCPTTLLAEQHAQTFRDRFAPWPIRVAELSRFRTGKETTATLAGIADGTIDIVIGTHKILGDKVQFANLGLIVIDEEHRFGVRQKEMLKKLRTETDILTLTATPIPRTLSMSLEGIRDLSVIATPPKRRLSVKTFVHADEDGLIREAVLRELKRGGQVYFLHNEVDTIENTRRRLRTLLPEARIGVAHGQMSGRELERVMREFYQQRYNILLCSTIIETGIDVPNANTIIIERADKFGLAQLHQLRGRVGRSHHQAYAYLLTPPSGAITKDAQMRLDAIVSLGELGSGFQLAVQDLEIRGAGRVLGEHQSGQIAEVGFDLYNQMLKDAIRALRQGQRISFDSPLETTTDLSIHAPALIPSDYVPDVSARLGFYKELSNARSRTDIRRVIEALGDRYGALPEPARYLAEIHRIRLKCQKIGIQKIDSAQAATVIKFRNNAKVRPMALIAFLQSRKDAKMIGPDRLRIEKTCPRPEQRLALLHDVLAALGKTEREARAQTEAQRNKKRS